MYNNGIKSTFTADRRPNMELLGQWKNPDLVLDDNGSIARNFTPDGSLYPPKSPARSNLEVLPVRCMRAAIRSLRRHAKQSNNKSFEVCKHSVGYLRNPRASFAGQLLSPLPFPVVPAVTCLLSDPGDVADLGDGTFRALSAFISGKSCFSDPGYVFLICVYSRSFAAEFRFPDLGDDVRSRRSRRWRVSRPYASDLSAIQIILSLRSVLLPFSVSPCLRGRCGLSINFCHTIFLCATLCLPMTTPPIGNPTPNTPPTDHPTPANLPRMPARGSLSPLLSRWCSALEITAISSPWGFFMVNNILAALYPNGRAGDIFIPAPPVTSFCSSA